ncbi:MAG TPA: YbgF trimerization domain-containing protein, partial [Gammaproteobacteria bacterium]|nr:YbgF trimerization domain-containing protein [Gammaproteobacteria bacterium]
MNKTRWPLAAVVLAAGCSSLTPSEDPVALRMTDMEARLIRLERVVENQSLTQLVGELERLRSETAALRGEIETLRFETENSDSRQRELYVDLDRRINGLESAPRSFAPPAVEAPGPGGGVPDVP